MKTKEQVLEHLKKTGYTRKSIIKIMGFLIGKGIKRIDEKMVYMRGEHDFEHFLQWFEGEGGDEHLNNTELSLLDMMLLLHLI